MNDAPGFSVRVRARLGRRLLDVALDTGAETLVVVGPNGAGKTSLLSAVLGAHPVDEGRVSVGGAVLLDTANGVDVPLEERRLGYVPQHYALFPHLSVRDNLDFALASAPPRQRSAQRAERVDALLRELGLEAHAAQRPATLSGGERQRVALARALCVSPRGLLLDEPLSALDVPSRRAVRAFLGGYLRHLGLPTIVVTHDAADARQLGHRIAVLEAGTITQTGTWSELVAQPTSAFVAELVAPGAGPAVGDVGAAH